MSDLTIDVSEFPNLEGQEPGRELELEVTAVVLEVPDRDGHPPLKGGSPSELKLAVIRADITQTT